MFRPLGDDYFFILTWASLLGLFISNFQVWDAGGFSNNNVLCICCMPIMFEVLNHLVDNY